MTALSSYDVGTVSVDADGTTVTGVSTLWLTAGNVKPGYFFTVGHFGVFITDVADDAHLTITRWPGATVSGAIYSIWKVAQGAFNTELLADVDRIVTALNANGYIVFVPPTLTAPDPSLGEENQTALQPTTGKMWVMTGGVWNYLGIYKGFNPRGAYDNAATYSVGDYVSSAGSSYVWINATSGSGHAPPNATYWQVLASKGDNGPAAWALPSAWTTATAYTATAPSSVVVVNGSTFVCIVSHTSGTFATDLAAGKWQLVAQAAPIYNVTSTASLLIAVALKAFTGVATNNAYQIGDYVRAKSNANAANYMEGNVTANSAGTLTVNVTKTGGSGTFTDWNISPTGAPGVGDMLKTDNLSGLANVVTAANNLGVVSYAGAQTLTVANKKQARDNISVPMRGYLHGLTISMAAGSSTFTVSAGEAADSTAADIITLPSAISKTLTNWAVGSGNGGVMPGNVAGTTWYHVWLIKRPDTGVVDVVCDLASAGTANISGLASGAYTEVRRIGTIKTTNVSTWARYLQLGDKFIWDVATLDDLSAVGTTSVLVTLNVPTGIQVEVEIYGLGVNTAQSTVWLISCPDQADTPPSTGGPFSGIVAVGSANSGYSQIVRTNMSGQVRKRANVATTTIYINTFGWIDRRGRDA
ncbi:hypothetical protein ABIB99_007195 [Bradyrhizobium sp. LA6.1]|uniref:hypothetical protein n=1 Tax=Bradyrhizobium sp. LA6.1 TaxID=3156378 RepID=UPI0033991463